MTATYRTTRRVLFHETDMAGVMHFSNFFRIMEEVEHAFWRSLGMSVHAFTEAGTVSWPRVASSCRYFAPVHFEEELAISLTITALGEKSLTYEVEFECGGKRVAAGEMKAACCLVRGASFAAIPVPGDVRAKLEAAISRKQTT